MKYKFYILIAIVIVILIIIFCLVKSANTCIEKYNNYLTGLWIGDPDFLLSAKLQDMQLFISPKENKVRQGYIIITDINGDFILNQPIEFKELNSSKWNAYNSNKKNKNDKFYTNYQTNIIKDFPKNIKIGVSMCDGTLTIHNTDLNILYALLEKDLISSAAAITAYKN